MRVKGRLAFLPNMRKWLSLPTLLFYQQECVGTQRFTTVLLNTIIDSSLFARKWVFFWFHTEIPDVVFHVESSSPASSTQQYGVYVIKIKLTSFHKWRSSGPYTSTDTDSLLITITHTTVCNQLPEFDLCCAGINSVMSPPTDQLIIPIHTSFIPRTTYVHLENTEKK